MIAWPASRSVNWMGSGVFSVEDMMPRRIPCLAVLFFFSFVASAQTTLNGAGSAFVFPIMSKWAAEYHKLHPEIRISYYPNGSWSGMVLTMAGMIDFGATDAQISKAQLTKAQVPVIHVVESSEPLDEYR